MANKELRHKSITLALILLFVSFYASNTLWIHSHTVNDVIVWHSHPFATSHSHSGASLQLISQLNSIVIEPLCDAPVEVFLGEAIQIETVYGKLNDLKRSISQPSLRAPPFSE